LLYVNAINTLIYILKHLNNLYLGHHECSPHSADGQQRPLALKAWLIAEDLICMVIRKPLEA